MLLPALECQLAYAPHEAREGWLILQVGSEDIFLRRVGETEFRRILRSSSRVPHRVATVDDSALWMYREAYFYDDDDLTQDEVHRQMAWRLPTG